MGHRVDDYQNILLKWEMKGLKVELRSLMSTCSEDSNDRPVHNPTNDNCCLQHTREVPGRTCLKEVPRSKKCNVLTKRSTSAFQSLTGEPDDKGDAEGESTKEEGKDLGQECLSHGHGGFSET